MYLHIGHDTVVRTNSIIGIFDIENTSVSKITKEFLNSISSTAEVINVTDDLPKSFILAKEDDRVKVYISQISVATLKKRGNLHKLP